MRNKDLEDTFITLSNFFYYIGQWFFGYQYLHVSLVLPKLFNVVHLKSLCKQGSDDLLNLIDESEPQRMRLSLISDENRSSKIKVKQIVKRLDLHIEKAIEQSVNSRFWLRLINALVITVYIICVGVAFVPTKNYLD